MKTQTVNSNVQTDKNFFTDLFVASGLSILGFLLLVSLIALGSNFNHKDTKTQSVAVESSGLFV